MLFGFTDCECSSWTSALNLAMGLTEELLSALGHSSNHLGTKISLILVLYQAPISLLQLIIGEVLMRIISLATHAACIHFQKVCPSDPQSTSLPFSGLLRLRQEALFF